MRIFGIVIDAENEMPLRGANISLFIGGNELAAIKSDSEGKFEYKETTSYIGETLICKLEKEKYQPQEVSYKIEQDKVMLEIELLPVAKEKIKIELDFRDEKNNPLEGVNITLDVEGKKVGKGLSDKKGHFKIALDRELKGKTLYLKSNLKGFKFVKRKVTLLKETHCEITLKKAHILWPEILAALVAVVFALIIARILEKPEPIIAINVFLFSYLILRLILRFILGLVIKNLTRKWAIVLSLIVSGIFTSKFFDEISIGIGATVGHIFLFIFLIFFIFIILLARLMYVYILKRRSN